jgi:hypothetical protein
MLNLVPASRPEAPDACGCTPPPTSGDSLQGTEILPTESTPTPTTASAAEEPRRGLKLVVTLTPAEHGQYRASLALGSEGCDPILRTATVRALTDALQQVPTLLEDAEAHWRLQPRNRAVSPMPPRRPPAERRPRTQAPPPRVDGPTAEWQPTEHAERDVASPSATEAVEAPKRPNGGQLTLFG